MNNPTYSHPKDDSMAIVVHMSLSEEQIKVIKEASDAYLAQLEKLKKSASSKFAPNVEHLYIKRKREGKTYSRKRRYLCATTLAIQCSNLSPTTSAIEPMITEQHVESIDLE